MIRTASRGIALWSVGAAHMLAGTPHQTLIRTGRQAVLEWFGRESSLYRRFMSPAFLPDAAGRFPDLPAPWNGYFLVAGFPRSGNLWLTALIASALDAPIGNKHGLPYVTFTHLRHDPAQRAQRSLLRGAVIVRNPRDCLLSLWDFSRQPDFVAEHGDHGFGSLEDYYFHKFLPDYVYRRPKGNFEQVANSYQPFGWPVVRYEDLRRDTVGSLRRLFDAWGVAVPAERLEAAAVANTKERLKRDLPSRKPGALGSHVNLRPGARELPVRVADDLERRFSDYLDRFGYALAEGAAGHGTDNDLHRGGDAERQQDTTGAV